MNTAPRSTRQPDARLTVREAAAAAGVHPATIRRAIVAGDLQAERVGQKLIRIRPETLEAWRARPVVAEDPDAAFIAEVVAAAGELTAEARSEIRRLLPAPSAGGQR